MSPDDTARPHVPADAGESASGDYSYDMAHDVPDAAAHPRESAANAPAGRPAEGPPVDADGDYSYDLAHEVPGRQDR